MGTKRVVLVSVVFALASIWCGQASAASGGSSYALEARAAGAGRQSPDIAVSPDSLYADLLTGQTDTQILTIENTGDADLEWEIGIEPGSTLRAGVMRQGSIVVFDASSGMQMDTAAGNVVRGDSRDREALNDTAPSSGDLVIAGEYTGDHLHFGLTDYGEIMPFQSPGGNEHLALGTWLSGYTVAYDDVGGEHVTYAVYDYRVGIVPVSYTELTNTGTLVIVEVVVQTDDGALEITRLFTFERSEKSVRVETELENISGGELASVVFKSCTDWDVDGVYDNDWDYDFARNMVYATEVMYAAVAGQEPPDLMDIDGWDDYDTRDTFVDFPSGPVVEYDGLEVLHYELGTLLAGSGASVTTAYAVGEDLAELEAVVDDAFVTWITAEPVAGIVPPGSFVEIAVLFDATGLFGGDYLADLVVGSNDPDEPEVVVPSHLHVTGAPDIAVSDTLLSYGEVFIGGSETEILVVSNEGTDLLTVSDVSTDEMDYTVDVTSFALAPGGSQPVAVEFTPSGEGVITGTLTITSDDPDQGVVSVLLEGEGLIAPDIGVSPDSLFADLLTGATETQVLTIGNTGGSDLDWEIGIELAEPARAGRRIGFHARERDGAPSSGMPHHSGGGTHERGVRDLGDVLGTYYNFPVSNTGMTWAGDALFVVDYEDGTLYKYDVETQQTVETHAIHSYPYGMTWDGEFLWIGQDGGNVYGYDLSGTPVGSFSSPVGWPSIAWDGSYFLISDASSYAVPFYLVDYDGSVIQTFSSSYDGYAYALEWVGGHAGGEIWVNDSDTGRICQLSLETGVVTLVSEFPFYDTNDAYSLSHDGTDLWWSDFDGPLYQIDDGIEELCWLVASPESGVVPAGASTSVDVTFDASGLFGGDYVADVVVTSNDPDEPEVLVPSHLHVTGAPDIAVSDTLLAYGGVFIGWSATETLTVSNEGTDLLTVSDVSTDHTDYTLDVTSFALAPGESQPVAVEFTPSSEGVIAGTLTILSDDPDQGVVSVLLEGEGLIAPDIGVSPDSLYADLLTGATETQILTIENTGGSDLEWGIDVRAGGGDSLHTYALAVPRPTVAEPDGGRGGAPASASRTSAIRSRLGDLAGVQILWDASHGQGGPGGWSTIIADLTARGATVTEGHDPVTTELLGGYDVVWTIDCYDTWSSGELSALMGWVAGGGGLLLEGDGNSSVLAYNDILAVLGAGITYSTTNGTSGTTSKIYAHETTEGVTSIYLGGPTAHLSSVVAPAAFLIDDMPGVPNTACSNVGHGRVVATADELLGDSSVGYADNQLFGNQVFDWLAGPQWLWAEPAEGTVAAGATVDVSIVFDASGLFGGDYLAEVVVSSNDPDEPEVVVPTYLHVTGAPDIAVSDTLLAYGGVFIGGSSTETLTVSNEGTDLLTVSDVSTDEMDYTVDVTSFALAPGESQPVEVEFSPSSEGVITGTLMITSDDPDQGVVSVFLEGEGLIPPDIGVSPDSLYADLLTGQTDTQILTIENTGESDLEWEIGIDFEEASRAGRRIGFHAREREVAPSSGLPYHSGGGTHESGVRDLGDVLGTYYDFPVGNMGMSWAGDALFVVDYEDGTLYKYDVEAQQIVETYAIHSSPHGMTWDGEFLWIGQDGGNVYGYDLSGTPVGSFSSPVNWPSIAWDGSYFLIKDATDYATPFYLVDYEGSVIQTFSSSYGGYANALEWVAGHADGEIWANDYDTGRICQLSIETGVVTLVGEFPFYDTSFSYSLSHDGTDLWWSDFDGPLYQIDDGIEVRRWLVASPEFGVVPAGASTSVDVTFDASGLFGGDYLAEVVVSSNDPDEPEVLVPSHLHVTGAPDIAVSDTLLSYGGVFIGWSSTETLTVSNEGTDLLTVSDVSTDEMDYTVDVTSFALAPGESQPVGVEFTPSGEGAIAGTLTILSDDPDEGVVSVLLEGEGLIAPDIGVSPDSLFADLLTGQTDTQILTIENTGGSDLDWGIDVRAGGSDSLRTYALTAPRPAVTPPDGDSTSPPARRTSAIRSRVGDLAGVQILWDASHGQGGPGSWSTIIADLTARGATVTEGYDPVTTELLGGYDVVWTKDCADTWTSGELSALAGWVAGGGGLLLEGDSNNSVSAYNAILAALGAGIEYSTSNGAGGTTSNIYPHETTEGIASIYLYYPGAHLSAVAAPGAVLVEDLAGIANAACSEVGSGQLVAMADQNFHNGSISHSDNQLFANQVFDWLSPAPWLSIDPNSGTVPAGGSTEVGVTFDATGLLGGDYLADILVLSNDPIEPEVPVATHLHVTGVPDIAVSDTLIFYGGVFVGGSATETLLIWNEGTGLLTVSDISSDHGDYSADPMIFSLPPYESQTVLVEFSPSSEGPITGLLTVLSDDPDEGTLEIVLEGEGIPAPEIAVRPDSLYAELLLGETETQHLTIDNTGGSDLDWAFRGVRILAPRALAREAPQREETISAASVAKHHGVRDGASAAPSDRGDARAADLAGVQILWDRAHGQSGMGDHVVATTDLTNRGAVITENHDPLSGELLSTYDVVWTTDCSDAWTTPEFEALAAWVASGGSLLLEGDSDPSVASYNIILSALGAGIVYSADNGTPGYTENIHPHPTTRDVVGIYVWLNRALLAAVEEPASRLIDDGEDVPVSAGAEVGLGRVIAMADQLFDEYHINYGSNRLFASQVFDWLARRVEWLTVEPTSGTVPAVESIDIAVTFDATSILGGDYLAEIVFSSNDPVRPETCVVAHLHAIGVPDIALSNPFLAFGEVEVGTVAAETLVVYSEGTGVLTVTDVSVDHGDFSVDLTSFVLPPGESQAVVVEFAPSSEGPIGGTLTILSDDPDAGTVLVPMGGTGVSSTPVEGSFYATLTESGTVMLRWTVPSLSGVDGFHVYRATAEWGPFTRVNEETVPPSSPGDFADSTVWSETTFWYEIRALFSDATESTIAGSPASVTTGGHLALRLFAPSPNPCRAAARIQFDLPDGVAPVWLAVYNVRGQLVRTVFRGRLARGRHVLTWDGLDLHGTPASSGVYFVMLEAGTSVRTRKLLLVK